MVLASIAGAMTVLAAVSGVMTVIAVRSEERAQSQLIDRDLLANERDGDVARHNGQPDLAIAKYGANLQIAATLVKREPDNPQWRFNVATAAAIQAAIGSVPG